MNVLKNISLLLFISVSILFSKNFIRNVIEDNSGLNISVDFNGLYEVETIKVDRNYQKIKFQDQITRNYGKYPDSETQYCKIVFYAPEGVKPTLQYSRSDKLSFASRNYVRAMRLTGDDIKSYVYDKAPKFNIPKNDSPVPELKFVRNFDGVDEYKLVFFPVQTKNGTVEFFKKWNFIINFDKRFPFVGSSVALDNRGVNKKTAQLNFKKRRGDKFLVDNFLADNKTRWLKVKNNQEGVLKVTGKDFADNGYDVSVIKLENIRVYSAVANDFNSLDNYNEKREYNLVWNGAKEICRNTVDVNKNGYLDNDDYVFFYVQGNHTWKRETEGLADNDYSDYSYYWIDTGITSGSAGVQIAELDDEVLDNLTLVEKVNSLEAVIDKKEYDFDFNEDVATYFTAEIGTNKFYEINKENLEVENDDTLKVYLKKNELDSGSYNFNLSSSNLRMQYNNNAYSGMLPHNSDPFLFKASLSGINSETSAENDFRFTCDGVMHLDYLFFDTQVKLDRLNKSKYHLYNKFTKAGNYAFKTSGFSDYFILDITDPYTYSGSFIKGKDISFTVKENNTVRHYLLIAESDFHKPVDLEVYDSRKEEYLHESSDDIDYLVVLPDELYDFFLTEGQEYLASVSDNNPSVENFKTVKISTIYNEFGQGYQQPEALRNALLYLHGNNNLKYVLLIGVGHFDYRNLYNFAEPNYIFPAHYKKSMKGSDTYYADFAYQTDDFHPEIAIGRFPVANTAELKTVLDKNVAYNKITDIGLWRTRLLFTADDEYNVENYNPWYENHIANSEFVVNYSVKGSYYIDKLYTTEFPFEKNTQTGLLEKPAAHDELIRKINAGVKLMMYFGHGSAIKLAHEHLFDSNSLSQLSNSAYPAFFISASCHTGSYAYPAELEQAQRATFVKLFCESMAGSIGSISACGPTYQNSNQGYFSKFMERLTSRENEQCSVGEAFIYAHQTYTENYKDDPNYYYIVGNPALILLNDEEQLTSDKKNLSSLKVDSISFTSVNGDNMSLEQFYVSIYEPGRNIAYSNQEHSPNHVINYTLPGKKIFSSKANLSNGKNYLKFIIPKDINYNDSTNTIIMYGVNSKLNEYTGSVKNVSVTGGSGFNDTTPPDIELLFNSPDYIKGDPIGTSPKIIVKFYDEYGINTSGNVGHKLLLSFNGQDIELNDSFEYDENSYQAGYASYQLIGLEEGEYTFTASGWDTSNNYNEVSEKVKVEEIRVSSGKIVGNLLNFPNPIRSKGTTFTFASFGTAGNPLESYKIDIYTTNGRRIKTLKERLVTNSTGFAVQKLFWDGFDADHDQPANGVYIYKLTAKFEDKTVRKKGKLLIAR